MRVDAKPSRLEKRGGKLGIIAICVALLLTVGVVTLAVFTDRASHSMQFTTASFNADAYELTRTAPVGPFCAGESVTATLKESNRDEDPVNSVISMKATWVSPDATMSIFGNANAADNAKISIGGTNLNYTVSADKKSATFNLPAHVLAAGTKDKARDLTLTIPESFKSTGKINFTFEKVVVGQDGGGFSAEFDRTKLNAGSKLDYGVKMGWAASSLTAQNGKALMGYLTEKNASGKYGISFELAFNYTSSPMKDFSSRTGAKWSYYKSAVDTLTFVEGMTSIGDYAFPDFSGVKSVSFPATVKTIGVSAFDASGLTGTVTIPATVKEIRSLAFGNLPNVKTFTFGHGSGDTLTLPDNTAAGKRNTGAFYVPTHVDTTVNSSVEAIQYGYKWHDGYDNRRLVPTLNAQDTWFRTYASGGNYTNSSSYTAKLDEEKLETITFADYHMPVAGETSWDASDPSMPGTVTAYLSADKTSLILAGNGYGLIFANEDSSGAFSSLTALKTVSNTDLLDTRNATTMASMFNFDKKLTNISVSTWNVSKVENMSNMFYSCDSLPSIDLKKNTCTAKDGSGQYTAWNTASLKNTGGMFMDYGGPNHSLTAVDTTGWDTSKLEDASYMFMECRNLTAVKGIENWNVSSLKTANNMFHDCQSLESISVANWKTTSLENTSVMFSSCHSLRSIDITRWDMSKVTKSNAMFSYCESLTELTLPKTLMVVGEYFAANCPKLTTITFNQPAGTNVQFGSGAFNINDNGKDEGTTGYIEYTPVKPLGTKVVTSNQKVLDYNWTSDHRGYKVEIKTVEGGTLKGETVTTYNGSKAVVAINGKTITFTATCKDSDWTYEGATIQYSQNGTAKTVTLDKNTKTWVMPVVDDKANEADVVVTPKWKAVGIPMLAKQDTWQKDGGTEKIDYDLLETINIVNKYTPGTGETSWSAAANETVDGVAYKGKVTAYLSADKKTLTIAGNGYGKIYANPDSTWAFTKAYDGMPALKKINGADVLDTQLMVNAGGMFAQNRNLESVNVSGWNTGKLQKTSAADGYYGMFMNCAKLKSLNVSNWNTKSVTEMSRMFSGCSLLSTIDVSKWNTSSCVYMNDMFYGAGISQIDMTGWDTGNLKYTYNMFKECANLTGIDLSAWDTSKLENCSSMFEKCEKLTSIELAGWNTAKVTDMSGMFYMCTHLPELYISSFNTRAVEDMENMFLRCDRLQKVQLGKDFLFKSGEKGYLPTPDSNYIPGTDGKWYVVGTKICYTPAELAPVVRVKTVTYVTDSNSVPGEGDIDPSIQVIEKPTQKGTLTYNGNTQYPEWNNYEPDKMTMAGVASGINAGSYVAKFTPKTGYCWKDGTADTIDVAWKIGKAPGSLGLSKYTATIDYNATTTTFTVNRLGDGAISVRSLDPSVADAYIRGTTVTVTKRSAGTATIVVRVAEGTNYLSPGSDTCDITCIERLYLPYQAKTLTYNGGTQRPTWSSDYSTATMTLSGTTSGVNAGSYPARFTPKTYYKWNDGTTSAKTAYWRIGKAPGSLSLSKYTATIDYNATTTTFTVTRAGNGTISATSSDTNIAAVSVSGTTVTVTKKAPGAATITVKVGAGRNHLAPANKTCEITCIGSLTVPSQKGTLTYNDSVQSPSWNNYDSNKMSISGVTSGTNAGDYTATFTPKTYYKWSDGASGAKDVAWKIGRLAVECPTQKGTLTYSGKTKYPTWNDYNPIEMTASGATSGINAGSYTAKFTPKDNYCWSDGTFNAKNVTWKIGKAPGSLSLSKSSVGIGSGTTATFTVTRSGDGAISVTTSNSSIATASVSGTTVTVTKKGDGTATITVKVAEGTNHLAPDDASCQVTCKPEPVLAEKNTWYKSSVYRGNITTLSLVDSYTPTGKEDESWDASEAQDGSVMAYRTGTEVVLAGNGFGKIYANEDSSRAFGDLSGLGGGYGGNGTIDGMSLLDTSRVTDMTQMFYWTGYGLKTLDVSGFDTAKVTDMHSMFDKCYALTSLDLSGWDTSNVTNMVSMFEACQALTSVGDLSGWDTSNVTSMYSMFEDCYVLTSLDLSGWNTSSVTSMGMVCMFEDCSELTSVGDLSGWDTSNVTSMSSMFGGCGKLTSVGDLSGWDTSNVTSMSSMFEVNTVSDYSALANVGDLSGWDTSNVTSMYSMFGGCGKLTSVGDLSGWDTSNVTRMSYMFRDCSKLASVGDLSGWNTAKVTDMEQMFYNCRELTSLDLSGWNTAKVTDMKRMFEGCIELKTLDLAGWDTSKVTSMTEMFNRCNHLWKVTLGTKFKFVGTDGYLPTPSAAYIPGVDGNWYDTKDNSKYTPASLASIRRTETRTYVVFPPTTNLKVPSQNGTLTYTGDSLTPEWNDYIPSRMTMSGVTSGINAGSYTATFTPKDNYKWTDGTSETKNVTWKIGKAAGSLRLNPTSLTIDADSKTGTIAVTRAGDGAIAATSNNPAVATVSVSGTTITVTKKAPGNATITVSVAEGTNHLAPANKTCKVAVSNYSVPTLAEGDTWYKGSVSRNTITKISFADSYTPTGSETERWDASEAQDGSVMAYRTGTEIVIAGDGSGKIYANEISCFAFSSVDFSSGEAFTRLTTIKGLDLLDTSKAINMMSMFNTCSALTSLDLSSWDTSNVTSMNAMFYGCSKLGNLNLSGWKTSEVEDTSFMFYQCSALSALDVAGFDTAKVANMSYMFRECGALTSMDLSGWNTSNVTNMLAMFYNCSKLTSVGDLSGWKTAKVTNMSTMFADCGKLTSLNLSGWDTSSVTNMNNMFRRCASLTTVGNLSGWKTAKVTNMNNMFGGCSVLTSLNLSGWDTSNVTNMTQMFYGCSKLTSVGDVSGWNTVKVPDMSGMFFECSALTRLDLSGWNTSNVTDMRQMFKGCASLTTVGDLSGWKTAKVADMSGVFYGCSKLTSLNLSGWDTSGVTDMNNMFRDCKALTTVGDLSGWNTAKVTDMSDMFGECGALTSVDVSGFDTAKVTDMNNMFRNCSALTSLDVSGWNTFNVTGMSSMFESCSSLTSLDLSSWDTSNVADMSNMFGRLISKTEISRTETETETGTKTEIKWDIKSTWCTKLERVTLGTKFKFVGTDGYLPEPISECIPGADGNWYDTKDNSKYTPASLASVTRTETRTYVAVKGMRATSMSIMSNGNEISGYSISE